MVKLDIKGDIQEVHSSLKELNIQLKHINKKILTALTIALRNKIAKNVYTVLKKDTGKLKKSIYKYSKNDFRGSVGSTLQYIAQTHEYGNVLRARDWPALHFKTKDGNWVTTKQVKIPARPFFFATAEAFVGSEDFTKTIQAAVDKAVKKAGL